MKRINSSTKFWLFIMLVAALSLIWRICSRIKSRNKIKIKITKNFSEVLAIQTQLGWKVADKRSAFLEHSKTIVSNRDRLFTNFSTPWDFGTNIREKTATTTLKFYGITCIRTASLNLKFKSRRCSSENTIINQRCITGSWTFKIFLYRTIIALRFIATFIVYQFFQLIRES